MEEKQKEEKKIKCFVIAGGSNVITEYYETKSPEPEGEDGIELYWVNPMLADFTRLSTGQTALVMSPMFTFTKNDECGPINPFTIISSYDLEEKFIRAYNEQVVKLKVARAGLVQAKMAPQVPKIGGSGKIQIAR